MPKDKLAGAWGELQAAKYLKKKGYKVIACNYRTRFGEIDIIAQNFRYLVFAEVKLRKSDQFGEAREFVGRNKQDRIRASAELWLQEFPNKRQPRFDVIEIYAPQGRDSEELKIIHLEDAFT